MRILLTFVFFITLFETFIELMIKAMDMEIIDWMEVDSWKMGKLFLMGGILVYLAFFRWTPFLSISRFKSQKNENDFSHKIKLNNIPWFLFSQLLTSILLLFFGWFSWKLNPNAFPFYLLLIAGAIEILLHLAVGNVLKLFAIEMRSQSIYISAGTLTTIYLKDIRKVEKKYDDEIYFSKKDGEVIAINTRIFDEKALQEFYSKLKMNCERNEVYFANDIIP